MKKQLEKRLQELLNEYKSGQKLLSEMDTKRENLQNSLLRISGAIQVLEEELAKHEDNGVHLKNEKELSNSQIE